MGFLAIFSSTVIALIGAIVVGLIKDEVAAWLPVLSQRIVARAVERLPKAQRELREEEWLAHLGEYPGKISQLLEALKIYHAAFRLQADEKRQMIMLVWWAVLSLLLPYGSTFPFIENVETIEFYTGFIFKTEYLLIALLVSFLGFFYFLLKITSLEDRLSEKRFAEYLRLHYGDFDGEFNEKENLGL